MNNEWRGRTSSEEGAFFLVIQRSKRRRELRASIERQIGGEKNNAATINKENGRNWTFIVSWLKYISEGESFYVPPTYTHILLDIQNCSTHSISHWWHIMLWIQLSFFIQHTPFYQISLLKSHRNHVGDVGWVLWKLYGDENKSQCGKMLKKSSTGMGRNGEKVESGKKSQIETTQGYSETSIVLAYIPIQCSIETDS